MKKLFAQQGKEPWVVLTFKIIEQEEEDSDFPNASDKTVCVNKHCSQQ